MNRRNISYHGTDELLDMLRQEVELACHTRSQIIQALEALTGEEMDDDGIGDLLEIE